MNKNQWIVFAVIFGISGSILRIMGYGFGYDEMGYFTWLPSWILIWLCIACLICAKLEKINNTRKSAGALLNITEKSGLLPFVYKASTF